MTRLLALPNELSLQIIEHLDISDKIRLGATCKLYRTQLLPEMFKTIRFTNNEASATSALIAIEAHGQYTRAIEFACQCGPDDELTTPSLQPAACKVLKGHHMPNLRTVRLKFNFDFDGGDEWDRDHPDAIDGMSIYLFEPVEDQDYVREKELEWKWRALMNETWEALAANNYVRELILDELLPKWTSTYRTDAFRRFLCQLESATFNIFGMDNGAGWHTNTVWGYIEFLSSLDASFFHHMRGLKHLYIKASDPLGLEGMRHIPLALKPKDLPLLQSLKLENCFIGPELVSFIRGHAQVLKSLDIKECVGATQNGLADNPLYWAEFFDEIYEAKPSLTEIVAGGSKAPLTDEEEFGIQNQTDELANIQHIRQKLEADPTLKLFGYASLDDKYGMFFMDEDENVERFNQGDDQRAYERLMGLVNENIAHEKF